MKEYKIAIIGAGNISNTRHIPALKKVKNAKLFGVIGIKESNVLSWSTLTALPLVISIGLPEATLLVPHDFVISISESIELAPYQVSSINRSRAS